MFPNVRLMIVAIMASIVGMSCGLGVFAAFRVNHGPMVRLPNGAPALRLVFSTAVPTPDTDAAATPFVVRFQVDPPRAGSAATPQRIATVRDEPAPAAAPAADAAAAMPLSDAQDSGPAHAASPHGAGAAAIASPAEQTAPAGQDAPGTKVAPQAAPPARVKAVVKTARRATTPQRVAKLRSPRKARARAIAGSAEQDQGLSQPSYQFTPAAQAEPARVRRAAKTTAATSSQ
jgi:hypothetical protein